MASAILERAQFQTPTPMLYEFDNIQVSSLQLGQPTDEELMERIKAHDESALRLLHDRLATLLRAVVSRVLHNDQDVDDVMQEILVEVWNRAERYDETKGKALGWIITMARRRAIDRVRRRSVYSRMEERLRTEVESRPTCRPVLDATVTTSDRAKVFQRVMASLPAAQQEALQLAFYRGLSQRDITAQTGIPLGTVKTRIELGLRKFRNALLALGGAEEWKTEDV